MTVGQWFDTIKNKDIKEQALFYAAAEGKLDNEAYSLELAIIEGFIWKDTIEGEQYWLNVACKFAVKDIEKTIEEYINQIDEVLLRYKALANLKEKKKDILVPSFYEAIDKAFIWDETPEGHEFWQEVAENAHKYLRK